MKKKQTAATQRKAQIRDAKYQILQAVGLTQMEYAEMQYHCGLSFLAYKVQWEVSEQRIQHSDIFWAWWVTNWAIRDEFFLEDNQSMIVNKDGVFEIANWVNKHQYLLTHNPYHLASQIDTYGANFHKAWLQILNLINNEAIKQAV